MRHVLHLAHDDLAGRLPHLLVRAAGIEQLRDAARRKDEFLAVLAHELRNPLAPIANAVELLNLRGSPVRKWRKRTSPDQCPSRSSAGIATLSTSGRSSGQK